MGNKSRTHYVVCKGHPHANKAGNVPKSHIVVETVLGKYLPDKAVVHHVDGDSSHNVSNNLVACEDAIFHTLLHTRQQAYETTGDPKKRKCSFCHKYDSVDNMDLTNHRGTAHRHCVNKYALAYYHTHKALKHAF
jgi:hypothetical protein